MKKHRVSFTVTFDQVDGNGRLFFEELFVMAHRAYENFMEKVGFGLTGLLEDKRNLLPIVHAEAKCRQPPRLGEMVQISLEVSRLGKTSFTLTCRFFVEARLQASVTTTHVWIEKEDTKPAPLPDTLRQALEGYF